MRIDWDETDDMICGGKKGYITWEKGKKFKKWDKVEKYFKDQKIEEVNNLDASDIFVRISLDEIPEGYREKVWAVYPKERREGNGTEEENL